MKQSSFAFVDTLVILILTDKSFAKRGVRVD
jgi:hypothetical protein